MGLEAKCRGSHAGQTGDGRLELEGAELRFRGEFRLKIDLKAGATLRVVGENLVVNLPSGEARFTLGAAAAKWKARIENPPSLLDKLGVKAESVVSVAGVKDADFRAELAQRCGSMPGRSVKRQSDLIFVLVERVKDLGRIARLEGSLKPEGGIWIVYPKGRNEIRQEDVMTAIKSAGLVDTKVCAFSATHTALKAVIPLARRAKKGK